VISKALESDLNGEVRTTAISYDDADVQVNQITVTFAAIASTTYYHLEALVCPCKLTLDPARFSHQINVV